MKLELSSNQAKTNPPEIRKKPTRAPPSHSLKMDDAKAIIILVIMLFWVGVSAYTVYFLYGHLWLCVHKSIDKITLLVERLLRPQTDGPMRRGCHPSVNQEDF